MSCNQPKHVISALDKLNHEEECKDLQCQNIQKSLNNIPEQCGKKADPIYQDFRYGIICDVIDEFKKREINKFNLMLWKILFSAIFPWDNQYDIFRQNVNRRFVVFPWVISMCKSFEQVKKALLVCLKYDIPLCLRSGAHCYEPYSLCDGMVIDQSRRTGFKINKEKQTVKIEPGCLNGPIADALSKYGLALPQGTCANVGIVGLALGGGMGFLGRKYGLTCDSLLELEMLMANGKVLTINKDKHEDLFWACKGAGGNNFGIVTSLTFKVYPVKEVILIDLKWPINNYKDLDKVLNKWLEILPCTDENLTTELDVFAINKNNPNPLLITGLYIGKRDKLNKILEPMLKLNPAVIDIRETTYIEAARHYTYQKFPPPFFKNKSTYAINLLPKNVSKVMFKYMKLAGPNDRVEFNCLGGAYAKFKPCETAYVHRDALAWIQWITRWGSNNDIVTHDPWEDFDSGPKKLKWLKKFYNEFIKEANNHDNHDNHDNHNKLCNSVNGAYINCPESELEDWAHKYYGKNLHKLLEIKEKYDKDNIFNFPQGLGSYKKDN